MSKTKFLSPSEYVSYLAENSELSSVPVSLAAEFLGVTPSMVNDLVRNKSLKALIVTGSTKKWKSILVSSLIDYKNSRQEGGLTMVSKIKNILEGLARDKGVIIYSELMEKVGMTSKNPHHRRMIGEYLGAISKETFEEEGFMLSALAVLKTSDMPNEIFFEYARQIGAMDDENDEDIFFQSQIKSIYRKYRAKPAK